MEYSSVWLSFFLLRQFHCNGINCLFKPREGKPQPVSSSARPGGGGGEGGVAKTCYRRNNKCWVSEHSPMIYERCTSLWEDNAIWNGPFHKSIPPVPSYTQDSCELLNPIMFSSGVDERACSCPSPVCPTLHVTLTCNLYEKRATYPHSCPGESYKALLSSLPGQCPWVHTADNFYSISL